MTRVQITAMFQQDLLFWKSKSSVPFGTLICTSRVFIFAVFFIFAKFVLNVVVITRGYVVDLMIGKTF